MPFAELPGARLFFTDEGAQDPSLLLVHGWGGDSHGWSAHLPVLLPHHRVIAPDLRGHGRSSVPSEGNTPASMAADLAALVRLTAAAPVVAVGHSMGAQVVTLLAVEHPDLVAASVVVDPAYGATGAELDEIPRNLARLRSPDWLSVPLRMEAGGATETTPPGLATWHRRRVMGMPQHVLAQAYAGMYTDADAFGTRLAAEAVLARRRCPTLALYSHEEPASWERGLPAPPGSTVVCWPGTGHYLHEEHPGDFVVVLRKWLAGLAAEGRLPCGR